LFDFSLVSFQLILEEISDIVSISFLIIVEDLKSF
jgi:hypothetical protein